MKIVVLGGGLAALGALEHLLAKPDHFKEILWVYPHNAGELSCSINSTALLARQGIERGISALGDDLYDAFYSMKNFIEAQRPEGVKKCTRYHLRNPINEEKNLKLEYRFSEAFGKVALVNSLEKSLTFDAIVEEAYSFSPITFINWWRRRILSSPKVKPYDDLVVGIEEQEVLGQKSCYKGDYIINATGSFGVTTGLVLERVKSVPGHYFIWYSPKFENTNMDSFFKTRGGGVLTYEGENLIYHSDYNSKGPCLIWGGSSEKDGLMGPRIEFLETKLSQFFQDYPQFKFSGERELLTGVRTKGPKRRPIISSEGKLITISGLYKNGYSLGYYLGGKALESLT